MYLRRICIVALLCSGFGSPARSEHAEQGCKLGVFPFLSAQRLEKIYAPIAAELDKVMDCDLSYHSASTYSGFMDKLANREFEIAYVQPFDYVRLAVPNGYQPLVSRSSQLISTIVAKQDSGINTLSDLRGKVIALPPAVAAVSYLTRVALEAAGIDPDTDVELDYTKNHGSCMHKVLIGKADACGTVNTVIDLFEDKNRVKFKVVARSPAIPQALFVVRDDIDASTRKKLQQQFFTMQLSEAARRMFRQPQSGHTFRVIDDKEFESVRRYWQHFKSR